MSRHFAVGVNPITDEEKKKIRKWLSHRNCAWWNWINGFWLIKDSTDRFTVDNLSDKLNEFVPKANVIVLEVSPPGDWAGYGPSDGKRDMFRWLYKNMKE